MLCWVIWPELKERTARIGRRGYVVFLDRGVTLVLLCFTQLICVGFCLNILVCHLHFVAMPGLCGAGDIKIGRGSVGVRACLFWCVQLSTLYGKNSLLHL